MKKFIVQNEVTERYIKSPEMTGKEASYTDWYSEAFQFGDYKEAVEQRKSPSFKIIELPIPYAEMTEMFETLRDELTLKIQHIIKLKEEEVDKSYDENGFAVLYDRQIKKWVSFKERLIKAIDFMP